MNTIEKHLEYLFTSLGLSNNMAIYVRLLTLLVLLSLLSFFFYWVTKKWVIPLFYKLFKKTSFTWDDALVEKNAFRKLAHITPALIIKIGAPILFRDFPSSLSMVNKLTDAYLIFASVLIVVALLEVVESLFSKMPVFSDKPIASYFQLGRIVLYLISAILILSVLLGKSPVYFLSVFGAMSAVVLLIFKDTILGFVSSIQMSANDMVRVGDWIEMPKFNADGDVIAINLNTVKVRNWDKTVTTIPTYFFTSDSFKNWRGMQESGGRRIKRSLNINVKSVKFVDATARESYKKIFLLKDYIETRQKEIEEFNSKYDFDSSVLINGRRMTNLGVFRHYVESYLKNHPKIHQGLTLLVRQLPLEDKGIPIEVYCFTKTTAWNEYEDIQADVFDHLLASASYFDLDVFQQVSGSDFSKNL
jgi:miniconductance mechanosensitive channel